MVRNRALGPRHERCGPLQMMLEGLGLFDRRLPTVGRQMTDQMQEITKPTKLGFGLCTRAADPPRNSIILKNSTWGAAPTPFSQRSA